MDDNDDARGNRWTHIFGVLATVVENEKNLALIEHSRQY
jgi:hypothetical protein